MISSGAGYNGVGGEEGYGIGQRKGSMDVVALLTVVTSLGVSHLFNVLTTRFDDDTACWRYVNPRFPSLSSPSPLLLRVYLLSLYRPITCCTTAHDLY
jgi:hypothetical protein